MLLLHFPMNKINHTLTSVRSAVNIETSYFIRPKQRYSMCVIFSHVSSYLCVQKKINATHKEVKALNFISFIGNEWILVENVKLINYVA